MPKASGESRLIVDYSHLRGHYSKPPLKLPSFPTVLQTFCKPVKQGDYTARIDLRAAFFVVPIPPRLRPVSAFRCKSSDGNVFNVLPMGLFASPAILQFIVQSAVWKVYPQIAPSEQGLAWTHLDDIFICGARGKDKHKITKKIIRWLSSFKHLHWIETKDKYCQS